MSTLILDGRPVAANVRTLLAPAISGFRQAYGLAPTLAIVRVGNPASAVSYALAIDHMFTESGMGFQMHVLPEGCNTEQLVARLTDLAHTHDVHGILLQRPLPPTIDLGLALRALPPIKDVEGVTPSNIGNLALRTGDYYSTTTPTAAIEILTHYGIPIDGKQALVIGRSDNVGKPLALLLLQANATVLVAHSRTRNLDRLTRSADLIFVAIGKPCYITSDMVTEGSTIIDFGVNVEKGRLVGDVDFQSVKQVAGAITPVPGGTGPVTTMLLMRNTLESAQKLLKQSEVKGRIKWLPILKSHNRQK